MYLTSPMVRVFALDAATGDVVWRFDPYSHGAPRDLARWSRVNRGVVNLRLGLDRETADLTVRATSPGIIFKDLLILGSTVGEGPGPAAPGHIRAYDVRSGERVWIFHTIPHPGETGYDTWPADAWQRAGGANDWGGLSLDQERGLVFAAPGHPPTIITGPIEKGRTFSLIRS